ncbi:MAG: hypothetical protein PUB14_07245 [Lachnospiraceae bacterium]|nr:hypothetical protein [Lachnospiraceae bacterium]
MHDGSAPGTGTFNVQNIRDREIVVAPRVIPEGNAGLQYGRLQQFYGIFRGLICCQGTGARYTADFRSITTSTGTSGIRQYRVSGTYPVGTPTNPVVYTFKLTKNITFVVNGEDLTLPITFQSVFSYFDGDNACPGLSRDYQYPRAGRHRYT